MNNLFTAKNLIGIEDKIKLDSKDYYYTTWENVPFLTNTIRKDDSLKTFVLDQIDTELNKLKDDTAWLRGDHSKCLMSVYDLYEFFLDSRVKFFWHYNHDNIHVSTLELDGRFTKMTDLKWFHRDTYKRFVLRQILNNPILQNRNFRIKTNLNCLLLLGREYKVCRLDQVTDRGFLIKIHNSSLITFLKENDELEVLFGKIPGFLDFELKAKVKSTSLLRFNSQHNLKSDAIGNSFLFIPFLYLDPIYQNKTQGLEQIGEMNSQFLKNIHDQMDVGHQQDNSPDLLAA